MLEWENILRVANSTGCLIALWLLAITARNQYKSWSDKTQDHWWALFIWVFIGMEGAVESLILQTTPGPRIILQTLAVALTLRALTREGELRANSEKPWKKEE